MERMGFKGTWEKTLMQRWTLEEDQELLQNVNKFGIKHWDKISMRMNKSEEQCKRRYTKHLKKVKGTFSKQECTTLVNSIFDHLNQNIQDLSQGNRRTECDIRKQLDVYKTMLLDKYDREKAQKFCQERKTKAVPGKLEKYYASSGIKSSTSHNNVQKKYSRAPRRRRAPRSKLNIPKPENIFTSQEDSLLLEMYQYTSDFEALRSFLPKFTASELKHRYLKLINPHVKAVSQTSTLEDPEKYRLSEEPLDQLLQEEREELGQSENMNYS